MRIISGRLKGRTFDSPSGHKTHPMSEKIRGAIFNALGDIEGLTVFDAFSGSGAIAFEAVSRGAKSIVATDITREAHDTIISNSRALGIEKYVKAVRANASGWSDNNLKALFDLVVVDPPYDDVNIPLLTKLSKHVKRGGLFIASLPPDIMLVLPGFEKVSVKTYGDAALHFYRLT